VLTDVGGMNKDVVDVVLAALKDRSPFVRSQAARALGNFGDMARGAVSELRGALKDSSLRVRVAAARALLQLEKKGAPAEALAVIVAASQAPDAETRNAAAEALVVSGPENEAAATALRELLDDPSPAVRRIAAAAVETVPPPKEP